MQQLHQADEQHRLLVRDVQATVTAAVNDANNECQPQREANQRNGAKCENNGYVIMEQVLQYKRLVDPPKGRGLAVRSRGCATNCWADGCR
jgi:hypothetical protein